VDDDDDIFVSVLFYTVQYCIWGLRVDDDFLRTGSVSLNAVLVWLIPPLPPPLRTAFRCRFLYDCGDEGERNWTTCLVLVRYRSTVQHSRWFVRSSHGQFGFRIELLVHSFVLLFVLYCGVWPCFKEIKKKPLIFNRARAHRSNSKCCCCCCCYDKIFSKFSVLLVALPDPPQAPSAIAVAHVVDRV